ncbi:universal stress protein [Candidatus Electronema sp. JM]|uniref:universal stress protein n=1 Tax=Candidatus Electronema sp. JM TaxID=3401571 RepID=UPI003AA9C794
MQTLLLATDGTEYSEGAVREAINFAKKCGSTIYAISAVPTMTDYEGFSAQAVEESMEAKVREHLAKLKARAEQAGAKCETILVSGEPHQCIVDAAEAKNVDMIVVGRRGAKWLNKMLLGEVAAKVIGYSSRKVLVVPRAAQITYQNILVATDGSSNSEAAVQEAVAIAKQCGGKVIALSSIRTIYEQENATANVNKVVELGKKEGVAVETLTPMGRSYETIVEAAGGRGVDLIVVGTYGKTGLTKMLMGSSTERVIGLVGCAVMVVKGEGGKTATV